MDREPMYDGLGESVVLALGRVAWSALNLEGRVTVVHSVPVVAAPEGGDRLDHLMHFPNDGTATVLTPLDAAHLNGVADRAESIHQEWMDVWIPVRRDPHLVPVLRSRDRRERRRAPCRHGRPERAVAGAGTQAINDGNWHKSYNRGPYLTGFRRSVTATTALLTLTPATNIMHDWGTAGRAYVRAQLSAGNLGLLFQPIRQVLQESH